MLKERAKIFRSLIIVFDLCLIAAAFFFTVRTYIFLLPVLLITWGYLLYNGGMYKSFRTRDISELFYIIFKSAFFGLLILSGAIYFFKFSGVSRNNIAALFLTATALLCLEKISLVYIFRSFRKKGYNFRNILIIGSGKRVVNFIDIVNKNLGWGYKIAGIIEQEKEKIGQQVNGVKIIGSFENLTEILHNNIIDEAIFIVPRSWLERIKDQVDIFETEGIPVSIAADFFDLKFAKARPADLDGFPLLTFTTTTEKYWQLFFKRALDIFGSIVLLIVTAPLILVIALTIKLTSPGPIFFKQKRCGLNGRKFVFHKFRTMVVGAEEQLTSLKDRNEMDGPVFKMKDDPRITPFGKFLRRSSLDELPQLWNVLIGHMSLVGPRPPIPDEVTRYDNWHRRRLSMRPGITCLWQVRGRNKISKFDDWMNLDLEYIDNWSLGLDFKILLMTVPVVIFGIGAK